MTIHLPHLIHDRLVVVAIVNQVEKFSNKVKLSLKLALTLKGNFTRSTYFHVNALLKVFILIAKY